MRADAAPIMAITMPAFEGKLNYWVLVNPFWNQGIDRLARKVGSSLFAFLARACKVFSTGESQVIQRLFARSS